MLVIRPEQMSVFKPAAEKNFENQIVKHLREQHSELTVHFVKGDSTVEQIPQDRLLEMVQQGIARARAYGITWETAIVGFIVLMFLIAPNFDDHPLIKRAISDESVPPNERIEHLQKVITEENWMAAKNNYNARFWELTLD